MTQRARELLECLRTRAAAAALAAYLRRQRWFAGRAHDLAGVRVTDAVPLRDAPDMALWSILVRARYADGGADDYHLLLSRRPVAGAVTATPGDPRLVALAEHAGVPVAVCDAMYDGAALAWLWAAIAGGEIHAGVHGRVRCRNLRPRPPDGSGAGALDPCDPGDITVLAAEQSNTSAVRRRRELLKCLRRVAAGVNPELELADALARAGFTHLPRPLGALEYHPADGGETTLLATVQPYLCGATDGWTLALDSLRDLFASGGRGPHPAPGAGQPVAGTGPVVAFAVEAAGLGRVTGEMHLAALRTGPGRWLRPRPVRQEDLDAWSGEMIGVLDALLAGDDPVLEPLRALRADLAGTFERVRRIGGGTAIRVHGDYHLGQTLRARDGWTVIDFEGEPNVPLPERRHHSCPLRDVAGMLRSFDYAAAVALCGSVGATDPGWQVREALARDWAAGARAAFWREYARMVAGSGLLPGGAADDALLRAFELRKAVYEVGYELGHRPAWVGVPLRFLLEEAAPTAVR